MKIVIPGNPIPKMRARHRVFGGYVHTYDPQEKDKLATRKQIVQIMHDALNGEDLALAKEASSLALGKLFEVKFWFYLPVAASDTKAQRNAKLWGFEPATNKPDLDNLEKFYLDCANEVLWWDDRMIVDMQSHKRYSDNPRVEIEIMPKKSLNLKGPYQQLLTLFTPDEFDEFLKFIHAMPTIGIGIQPRITKEHNLEEVVHILNGTAQRVIMFAKKYASALKKIEKLGEFPATDMEESEEKVG